jgi:hypothetical protein
MCTEKLKMKYSKLCTKKSLKIVYIEEVGVSIPIALHTGWHRILDLGLHNILDLVFTVILTVFFCNWKTILLSAELLQNTIPYFVIEWKLAKYIILSVYYKWYTNLTA